MKKKAKLITAKYRQQKFLMVGYLQGHREFLSGILGNLAFVKFPRELY